MWQKEMGGESDQVLILQAFHCYAQVVWCDLWQEFMWQKKKANKIIESI